MKDYRLSEIKDICEQQGSCDDCECADVCHRVHKYKFIPNEWDDIEPRDMIELPCKLPLDEELFPSVWIVMYYKKTGAFGFRLYNNEVQADAFLAELKGERQ